MLRMKYERLQQGLRQRDVAIRTGLKYNDIETKKIWPTDEQLQQIADVLDVSCSLRELLDEVDEDAPAVKWTKRPKPRVG